MASQPIYELYVELEDYQPKIWRRFQVANNVSIARLGYILMTMFEMKASHLFRIEVPVKENLHKFFHDIYSEEEYNSIFNKLGSDNTYDKNMIYEIITEDTYLYREKHEKVYDAVNRKLKDTIDDTYSKLLFVYDFGDNWTVLITLERIFKDDDLSGKLLPRVLEGEGYGIVEDCGGVYALENLSKAFRKKKGSAYNEYRQWLGIDDFNLESFDIEDMNFRLKKVPRIYKDIYEYNLVPTKHSMDILERRYLK